jgi:uncharacterized membrane protein YjgN (DUF898 family)
MEDIIGWVLLVGLLFGLEIVAIFILVMSLRYARQLVFVLLCGGVAAVLMAVESIAWWICAAGGYEFGFRSDTTLSIVSAVSIVSLGVYFPAAIMRCKRTRWSNASRAT